MGTVVLIRPGATDFDDENRIQGALELPLNARGLQQVESIAEQLRDVPLEVIYTSPSEPSRSTAQAIGESLGVTVKESENLRNLNQGLWQGLLIDEVRRKYPRVLKQWQDAPESICPPEGEMVSEALERVQKALAKPLKQRSTFAVVAAEPLASVIRKMVSGDRGKCSGPMCGSTRTQLLEILRSNGTSGVSSEGAVNGDVRMRPPVGVAPGTAPRNGESAGELGAET